MNFVELDTYVRSLRKEMIDFTSELVECASIYARVAASVLDPSEASSRVHNVALRRI